MITLPFISSGARDVRARVKSEGFCLLESFTEERFLSLAKSLGDVTTPRFSDPALQILKPTKRLQAAPRSLSVQSGLGRIPFHTDCAHHPTPPGLVLLYSVDNDTTETPTEVLVVDRMRARSEPLLSESWVFHTGRKTFLSPVFYKHLGLEQEILRFDSGCMPCPSSKGEKLQEVFKCLRRAGIEIQIPWKAGNLLILDNYRCLHSRPEVRGSGSRILTRVLVK